jgi:hypothetical protein
MSEPMALFCAYCMTRVVQQQDITPCPACGSHHFSILRRPVLRSFAYTPSDLRFLRSIRVKGDSLEVVGEPRE